MSVPPADAPPDESRRLRAEVERLRGLLRREGIDPEGAPAASHRRIVESAIDFAVIALDLEGRITHWNEGARRILGWTLEEMRGRSAVVLFTPEDRARDVPEQEQRAALAQGRALDDRWHLRRDGTRFWASGEMMPLRDDHGAPLGFVKILRDRTGQRQAEEERERFILQAEQSASALRQSDERLQLALKSAGSVGVWDWDMRTDQVYMDAHCARMFSVAPELAAAGEPLQSFLLGIHPEDRARVGEQIQHCIATDGEYESEYRLTPREGERWVQTRGRVHRDEQGRPERFPGIVLDITRRKQAELRQRALLELSDRLRDLGGSRDIGVLGAELIGRTLGLSRVGFALVDVDARTLTVEQDWNNGQVASIAGGYAFSAFGSSLDVMLRGESILEPDAEAAAWIPPAELPNYRALDMRGFMSVPLMRQERLVGFVYVHSSVPRAWSQEDVGFVREAASRTWEAIERAQAERRLRASEQDLRLFTDQAPELIGYVDRDLVYRFVNRTYVEWFSRPLEQVVGKSALELLGPEAFALREPYFRRALAGEAVRFEAPLETPGLPRRELELRFSPRRDPDGAVQGVYLFILDITERKLTERVLRETNEQLEQRVAERTRERDRVWNLSNELMGVIGLDGYLKAINPAWSRLLGHDERTLLARPFLELVHPEDHAAVMDAVTSLARGERLHRLEDRLRRSDGSYRSFSWTAVPGEDGVFYAIARDVTDERAAVELQRRLFDVLDQSPDFIGISDLTGRPLYVNASGRRMMGIADLARVGERSLLEYFAPEERPRIEDTALPAVLREGKWVGRSHFRHFQTGEDIPVEYNVFLSRDAQGEPFGLGTVTRDITQTLQHEQALRDTEDKLRQSQKMEAVGQLTGGIAHDFNNLLGGIVGAMEMLRRRLEAGRHAEAEKYISATMNSAHRAAALTARLLAFGRRQSLDVKPTDVNALVTSMADLLRRTLGETVSLKTLLDTDVWRARTDANQFENALLNLAINARDAMPQGGKLTVETHNTRLDDTYARGFEGLKAGDFVVMSVSDTGQGMPPEVIARAFEPFFTTKPIGQGTGLGLSMIYGFAKQVGGHVRIYSEVGQGTTIKLYMPRHVGEGALTEPMKAAAEPPRAQEGETVLVVEDEPAVRMLVMEILEDLGYAAHEAHDARSALPFLERGGRIDLLVTDVGLPGGTNGRQLAEVARQRRPGLQVLFITGYAEGASVRGGFLAPGMEMITKPFALDVLAAKIREMIERQQGRRPVN